MKKLILGVISSLLVVQLAFAGQLAQVTTLHGLASNPNPDKIQDGAHVVLDNMYVYQGDLQVVKGRTRLNSTAHSDATVNGFWYYESSTGTKKLVVKESTKLVTYDTDGTNRTEIKTSLTNEKMRCVQEGDTLYCTSLTDGLYKWTGSGSASSITGVAAPSAPSVSASGTGGMTPGLPAIVTLKTEAVGGSRYNLSTGGTCIKAAVDGYSATNHSKIASSCGGLSATYFATSCATSTTYSYKVTKWNSQWGIESEPSTAGTASLVGDDAITTTLSQPQYLYSDNACTTGALTGFYDYSVFYSGRQTATTQTLASAPSTPFDGFCVYRTVANGSDYFKQSCVPGGGSTYTDGKPDAVLGDPLDTTIDTIDPPKASYIETYKGILFLAQGNSIYFTHLPVANVANADTYWLASDSIKISSDNVITGLKKTQNALLIFTNKNVYELTGFGVHSFRLKSLIQSFGAISQETIELNNDGDVFMFSGTNGIYKIRASTNPQDDANGTVIDSDRIKITRVSEPDVRNIFQGIDTSIVLTPSDYPNASAYYDSDRGLYFLYIGQDGFIFDENNKSWSHEPATKMIAATWVKSANATGYGYLIDNLGFFYKNFVGYTTSGIGDTVIGNPTSSGNTTLTDMGATFNTTNDGLKGVWVAKWNGTNGIEYRQISSNTSTQLTVSSAWTVNPLTTDTYFIGYLVTNWMTKQYNFQPPPKLTQLQALSLVHNLAASTQTLYAFIYVDKSSSYASSNLTNPFDLSAHITMPNMGFTANSSWIQFQFLSFVYNTSDTVVPPVDIVNYSFRVVPKEGE